MNYRYSVVTFVFGGYEVPHEVENPLPDVEYVLVTDRETESKTWKVVVDRSLAGTDVFRRCWSVRYGLFRYCSTDVCLCVDGSVAIRKTPDDLVRKFAEGGYDYGVMCHYLRNDVREEIEVWKRGGKWPKECRDNQLRFLDRIGHVPGTKGLITTSCRLVRKNPKTLEFEKRVFDACCETGTGGEIDRVDQTLFSALFNMDSNLSFMLLSPGTVHSEFLQITYHHTNKPIPRDRTIPPKGVPERGWIRNRLTDMVRI